MNSAWRVASGGPKNSILRRVFHRYFRDRNKNMGGVTKKPLRRWYGEYRGVSSKIRQIPLCERRDESTAVLVTLAAKRLCVRADSAINLAALSVPSRKVSSEGQKPPESP